MAETMATAPTSTALGAYPLVMELTDERGHPVLFTDEDIEREVMHLTLENRADDAITLRGVAAGVPQLSVAFRQGALADHAVRRLDEMPEVPGRIEGGDAWFALRCRRAPAPGIALEIDLSATHDVTLPSGRSLTLDLPAIRAERSGGPRLTRVRLAHGPGIERAGGHAIPEGFAVMTFQVVQPMRAERPLLRAAVVKGAEIAVRAVNEIVVAIHAVDGRELRVDPGQPASFVLEFLAGSDLWALSSTSGAVGVVAELVHAGGRATFEVMPHNIDQALQVYHCTVLMPEGGNLGRALYLRMQSVRPPLMVDRPPFLSELDPLPAEIRLRYSGLAGGARGELSVTVHRVDRMSAPPVPPQEPARDEPDFAAAMWFIGQKARMELTDLARFDATLRRAEARKGRVEIESPVSFVYLAPEAFTGSDNVTVWAEDSAGKTIRGEVSVTVSGPPPAQILPVREYLDLRRISSVEVETPGMSIDDLTTKPPEAGRNWKPGPRFGYTQYIPAPPFGLPCLEMTVEEQGSSRVAGDVRLTGGMVVAYSSFTQDGTFHFAPIPVATDVPHAQFRAEVGLDVWVLDRGGGQGWLIRGPESYAQDFGKGGRTTLAILTLRNRALTIEKVKGQAREGDCEILIYPDLIRGNSSWPHQVFRSGFFVLRLDGAEVAVVDPRLGA